MKYQFVAILIMFLVPVVSGQSLRNKINKGNDLYKAEKYDEALNTYQDALLDDPQNKIAIFNKGDALYKNEQYENW